MRILGAVCYPDEKDVRVIINFEDFLSKYCCHFLIILEHIAVSLNFCYT